MKVIFTPEVEGYFYELEAVLYKKGYFGFLESSQRYVDELIRIIIDTLPVRLCRPAPPHFDQYGKGMLCAAFRHSRATTWYVFFSRYEYADGRTIYLVRHIENNHTAARYMKKTIKL